MKIVVILILLTSLLWSKSIVINFDRLSISELITITSKVVGKNIFIADKIEGNVSFVGTQEVNEKELIAILEKALLSKGFFLNQKERFWVIEKHAVHKDIQIVLLKYTQAKELAKLLQVSLLKNSENIIAFLEEENALLLQGDVSFIESIKKVVKKLDKEKAQVFIQAKIIEVNNTKVNQIGIEYGILGANSSNGKLLTFSSKLNSARQQALAFPLGELGISLSSAKSAIALGATLNFLNQKKAIDVVSEPSILCLNNMTSSIYVGEKKSIKVATTTSDTGSTKETFNREDSGLILKVKPRVTDVSKVQLEIHTTVENFSRTNSTNEQPDTFKKEVKTTVVLNNGESVILGGLMEDKKEEQSDNVPVLSQIPLLGMLFQNSQDVILKKNLAIVVTPYIIPKSKDLTYLRNKLAQLKLFEEDFAKRRFKKQIPTNKEIKTHQELHDKRVKEYLGM